MNLTQNRLLIFLRDRLRRPYNAIGVGLLGLRLAGPFWLAATRRRIGRAGAVPTAPPPIIYSFADWYRRSAPQSARYVPIYPETRVAQPAARTIAHGRRDPWRLHRYDNTRCAPAFVAGLPNGRYDGLAHDIFSPDGRLLADLSFFGPENRFRESRDYARRFARGLPPAQDWPGTTAALAALYADVNYFHWMFHVLPRFELLRLAGIAPEHVAHYLLPAFRHPFQTETLARLHIPLNKVALADEQTHLRAEYLWTTSSLRLSGHLNEWVADFLRREFLGGDGPPGPAGGARLFISRADAAMRRLVNEPEIAARLAGLGFRTVTPGQHTVAEQARLFAEAAVIVAPHGAGLTNLVFAKPGTVVLELLSPTRRGPAYWELSNARGLDYYYLIGQEAHLPADAQAFTVPLAWLERLLDRARVR